jgi:hypothetical protein
LISRPLHQTKYNLHPLTLLNIVVKKNYFLFLLAVLL